MAYLTALLPVADAVAAHTALVRAADTTRSSGQDRDGRGRGQVMADTLVDRLTRPSPSSMTAAAETRARPRPGAGQPRTSAAPAREGPGRPSVTSPSVSS